MMKLRLTVLSLMVMPLVAMAALRPFDGVAAYVNDKVLTVNTVIQEMYTNFGLGRLPEEQQNAEIMRYFPVVCDLMINRLLVLDAYEKEQMQLPNEAVASRVQEIIATEYQGDKAKLQEQLKAQRMTYDMWEKTIREDLIFSAMRHLQINSKVNVSPGAVRAYYEQHKDRYAAKQKMHVHSIALTPDQGRVLAEELMKQLEQGASFAAFAKQYSCDERAEQGGDWGFVVPTAQWGDPTLLEAVTKLAVGQRTLVEFAGGYCVIFYKEAAEAADAQALTGMWDEVEADLRAELSEQRYKTWLQRLRDEAYVEVIEIDFSK